MRFPNSVDCTKTHDIARVYRYRTTQDTRTRSCFYGDCVDPHHVCGVEARSQCRLPCSIRLVNCRQDQRGQRQNSIDLGERSVRPCGSHQATQRKDRLRTRPWVRHKPHLCRPCDLMYKCTYIYIFIWYPQALPFCTFQLYSYIYIYTGVYISIIVIYIYMCIYNIQHTGMFIHIQYIYIYIATNYFSLIFSLRCRPFLVPQERCVRAQTHQLT